VSDITGISVRPKSEWVADLTGIRRKRFCAGFVDGLVLFIDREI
jgi:hypothetical protein